VDLDSYLLGRIVARILQWIGGALRFLYGTLIRKLGLTKRRSYTFQEYVNGPAEPDDVVFDTLGHVFNNRLLGLLVVGVLVGMMLSC
jgi:hypothetical protein